MTLSTRTVSRLLSVVALAACGGCAHMVESRSILPADAAPADAAPAEGTVYYLPKHLVRIVVNAKPEEKTDALSVLPAIPDTDHGYVAVLNHKGNSSDHLVISTTPEGLLTAVQGQTEDETGDIILKLAEAAVEVAKLIALPRISAPAPGAGSKGLVPPRREFIFDPLRNEQLSGVQCQLVGLGYRFEFRAADSATPGAAVAPEAKPGALASSEGIFYRRARAYVMTLSRMTEGKQEDIVSMVKPLAQGGPIAALPFDRGAFTKTEYAMSFENGLLTKTDITRPSEALGAASILPNALKSIVSIPAEIIQLRINYSNKTTELLKAEQALLDARKALEEQIESLRPATGAASATGNRTGEPPNIQDNP